MLNTFQMCFLVIYPTDKRNAKCCAKINTMQNINVLLFVCSLSLTSLMLCS